jgi:ubiquinone/menaquinone biosynthesis C-methylase UbiE
MNIWDKKRRLMRRYDQSARAYDNQYRDEQEAKITATMDNMTVTTESVILDVGCGTGLLFNYVAKKAQFIVGTDISRALLSEAKKKAKTYGNIMLVQSDFDNLPFRDEDFDLIFAVTVVQNAPSPQVTLSEVRRVSKSNAKVIVTGLKKSFTENEFVHTLEEANLRVESIMSDKDLKDYICVCSKAPVKPKWRTK